MKSLSCLRAELAKAIALPSTLAASSTIALSARSFSEAKYSTFATAAPCSLADFTSSSVWFRNAANTTSRSLRNASSACIKALGSDTTASSTTSLSARNLGLAYCSPDPFMRTACSIKSRLSRVAMLVSSMAGGQLRNAARIISGSSRSTGLQRLNSNPRASMANSIASRSARISSLASTRKFLSNSSRTLNASCSFRHFA
eukprot:CAMPEP_0206606828 /NCGR_PEP_ID=MMETSP0325_2-20121206/51678_1 /ASSEMBLY_ACC=CAM_ASM_000347 /TAXON_ID=2866 /ORGANISM="Crypthecodinium cohnii, Strain Seligo" /LENGTH=200 /DNA_ID=CAMNT_0054123507 /DNA_START=351 /DNA_END=950 /DNA_ORIENTATION=+